MLTSDSAVPTFQLPSLQHRSGPRTFGELCIEDQSRTQPLYVMKSPRGVGVVPGSGQESFVQAIAKIWVPDTLSVTSLEWHEYED